MNVSMLERELGIEVYASRSLGIGGKIRQLPEDFVVEEILSNGSKAETAPIEAPQVSGRGRYLVCVLVKRNWDTILAVKTIANQLGIDSERIQIAGIKDAKAVTAQHISISRTIPEQVSQIKIKNIRLHPLRFLDDKIHSGMLFGNKFHITIKAIVHSSSKIEERTENVQNELESFGGTPNFFGHQRFGTIRPVTHLVGKNLVRSEWEEAALTFLAKSSEYEHPESRQAREQLWKTENFREALHYFPHKLGYERIMLNHLAKYSRDFVGAFRRLPTKLLQLFVQAYQSYLFNRFLSQRIKLGIPLNEIQTGDQTMSVGSQKRLALPLIGFKQLLSSGVQGEIERQVLEKENVKPPNFHISTMPEISAAGGLRTAVVSINGFSMGKPSEDSANSFRRKLSLDFTLRSGSYATIVLREFMKPQYPIKAGF